MRPVALRPRLTAGLPLSQRHKMRLYTADFSVVDPYRMMRTHGFAEEFSRPIVHAWRARVKINANRCSAVGCEQRREANNVKCCLAEMLQEGPGMSLAPPASVRPRALLPPLTLLSRLRRDSAPLLV